MPRVRRKYPRKKVFIPVEYTSENTPRQGRIWTLGAGGLFLGITEKIAVGAEVTVRFRPAPHLPVVEARAKVCYQTPDEGVALEFTDIKPEHRDMILLQIGQRMAEKRRFPRAPIAVQVEHEGGVALGSSRDISAGGMFIETREPVSAYASFKVRFNLDDGGPIIKTAVEVRYTMGRYGVGVQFAGISLADRDRIHAYVTRGEPGL